MEDNLDAISALQKSIDELFLKYADNKCSMFKDFEYSFSKLDNVLDDATNHIEKVDRSLSEIERDVVEIKELISSLNK